MIFRRLRFCFNYFLALIATFILLMGIEFLPGLSSGHYALLVLPLLIVSTIEGQQQARHTGERPRNCRACLAALQMLVLAVVIAKLFHVLGTSVFPGLIARLELPDLDGGWQTVALYLAVGAGVLRFGYAFGLANELKGQQISDI